MFFTGIKPPPLQEKVSVSVTMLAPGEHQIELLFRLVLDDYLKRFDLEIKEKYHVGITIIDWSKDDLPSTPHGITIEGEGNRILVQVSDPYMDENLEANFYSDIKFMEILCHEMVHACQYITKRMGLRTRIKYDKKSEEEKYFFDPMEIEARLFEAVYASKFATSVMTLPIEDYSDVSFTEEVKDEDQEG